MNVKTAILFAIVLMLVLCGNVLALDYFWDGGGTGDLWTTSANWNPNGYPFPEDGARVEDGNVVGQPLIDSTVTASHQKVRIGTDQNGCSITMTGGSLEANHTSFGFILALNATGEGSLYMSGDSSVVCAKGFWAGGHGAGHLYMSGNSSITNGTSGVAIGYYSDGSGTLTMSDNSSIVVSATQNFMVGGQGYGSLDMTGGSITTGKFFVGWSGGSGDVQFDGGTIHSAGWAGAFSMQPGSLMDITGGVMTIDDPDGSRVAHMEGYVTAGQLSGYDYYDLDHVVITYYPASQTTKIIAIANPVSKIVVEESDDITVVHENPQTLIGNQDSYTISLLGDVPVSDVNVVAQPVDANQHLDLGAGAGNSITLTFTTLNWDSPQSVTVTAVNDGVPVAGHSLGLVIGHTVNSSDPNYNGAFVKEVEVIYLDDDGPYITFLGDSLDVNEQGPTSDQYDVKLQTQPAATVTVDISVDAQVVIDVNQLTFDSGNWNVGLPITVTAVNDIVLENDPHDGVITHTLTSSDADYNDVSADVVADIFEDECGAWGYHPGDADNDCDVDMIDFALTAGNWLGCTQPHVPGCADTR